MLYFTLLATNNRGFIRGESEPHVAVVSIRKKKEQIKQTVSHSPTTVGITTGSHRHTGTRGRAA